MKISINSKNNYPFSSVRVKPFLSSINETTFNAKIPKEKKFKVENLFEFKRSTGDLILSIFFLIFVLFLLINFNVESGWENRDLSQKRVGKILKQQWLGPLICMFILVPATILNFYQSIIQMNKNKLLLIPNRVNYEISQWLKSIEFIFYFLIYTNSVAILGYLLSTLIFAVLMTYRLGYRSKKWMLTSTISAFVIVIIFRSVLQIKTPVNIWLYKFLPSSVEVFMKIYF